jgi:hypothetical protein
VGLGHVAAYVINEHEEILESPNASQSASQSDPGSSVPNESKPNASQSASQDPGSSVPNESKQGLRLVGPGSPPSCEDALASETTNYWHVWNEKPRREGLPGDRNP